MTREQFKDLAMEILSHQTIHFLDKDWKLFNSENIDDYKITEYDEDGFDIENYPFEEFLNDMYDAVVCVKRGEI